MADPTVATIARFMRPPYLTVEADDQVRVAYRRMEGDQVRSLVVVRDGQYVGVVEWQQIRRLPGDAMSRPVRDYVRRDLPYLTASTTIADAMAKFESTDVRSLGLLPVVDARGRLEGLVEREEFQGVMQDSSGTVIVPEDPVAHLVTGPNVPRPGAKVVSSDGRKLGTFERHIEDRWRPRWMLVKHGLIRKKRKRVPLVAVERQTPDEVVLKIDRATWHTFPNRPAGAAD